jgi:NAD/NADP transhydrogenase beta subunit
MAHFLSSDFGVMLYLEYKHEWNQSPITSILFKELSVPLWISLHLPYIIVMIFGIIGIQFQEVKGNRRIWLILLVIISFILVHLIFFGGARFRMPIMPLMFLFAASGWKKWRLRSIHFCCKRGALTVTMIHKCLFCRIYYSSGKDSSAI